GGAGADHAGEQHRRRQVGVFLLMVLGEVEAVEADLLAELGLLLDFVDQPGDVIAARRILSAWEITDWQHRRWTSSNDVGLSPTGRRARCGGRSRRNRTGRRARARTRTATR